MEESVFPVSCAAAHACSATCSNQRGQRLVERRCLTHRPPQRGRSSDDVVTPGSGRPHGREGKFWYQGSSCLPYLTWSPSRLHIQPLTIVVMHIEFAKYIMSNSTSRKPPSIMNSYCGGIAPSRDAALSHAFDRRRGGIHCKAFDRHWEARWPAQ